MPSRRAIGLCQHAISGGRDRSVRSWGPGNTARHRADRSYAPRISVQRDEANQQAGRPHEAVEQLHLSVPKWQRSHSRRASASRRCARDAGGFCLDTGIGAEGMQKLERPDGQPAENPARGLGEDDRTASRKRDAGGASAYGRTSWLGGARAVGVFCGDMSLMVDGREPPSIGPLDSPACKRSVEGLGDPTRAVRDRRTVERLDVGLPSRDMASIPPSTFARRKL